MFNQFTNRKDTQMKQSEKQLITDTIAAGYTHAYNDSDSGVFNAINNGYICKSYQDAESDLAALLGDTVEEYRRAASSPYTRTSEHTWIYDLQDYLKGEEVDA
jgi:predicted phosphodiesterase